MVSSDRIQAQTALSTKENVLDHIPGNDDDVEHCACPIEENRHSH